MTATWYLWTGEVEPGLVPADLPAVVRGEATGETAVVCQSVGSTSQTEDFQRSLKVLICFVGFLRL